MGNPEHDGIFHDRPGTHHRLFERARRGYRARALRAAGHLTIATARSVDRLANLKALGCEVLALDVADEASRRAAIGEAERRFGALGVLINNAGYGQYGPLEEISPEHLRRVFETNLFGMLRLAQLALPGMRAAGRGRIVNISSVAGRVTTQGGGAYHMTKFAVEALADALRPEVKPFGIDVVNVLPGPFVSRYGETAVASIPDTGPDSPYAVYKRGIAKIRAQFRAAGRLWRDDGRSRGAHGAEGRHRGAAACPL